MAIKLTVQTDTLKDGSKKISNHADNFERIYKELIAQVESMGEAYKGDENDIYVSRVNELTTKLNAMTEHLRNASQTLQTQAQNYEDRKNENIAQIGKLSI